MNIKQKEIPVAAANGTGFDSARTKSHQRIRIRRLSMSGMSYLIQIAIASLAAALGSVDWMPIAVYTVVAVFVVGGFYVIFALGLNLRFRRPNLTFAQVLGPVIPGMYVIAHIDSPQVRAAYLLTVMTPLLYGMLDLSMRRFLEVAVVYFLAYCVAFVVIIQRHPERLHVPAEWVVMVTLALMLVQIGLIGGYISRLRHTLRQRNQQLNDAMGQISEMAVRDELTGSFNRRRLIDVLQGELHRIRAGDGYLSLCLIDIDHFKTVNDIRGHLVGDRVLARCAASMEHAVRQTDTFGRYGGEEFLLIMPNTNAVIARGVAERLRTTLEAMEFVDDQAQAFGVTLSAGVATITSRTCLDTQAILRRADKALYCAKKAGRNCVHQD